MSYSPVHCAILEPEDFESVKSILAKVSHDLNNLLMPIMTYPEIVRMDLQEGSGSGELLDVIVKAGEDIQHIAQQMVILASTDQHTVEAFDLNALADQAVELMKLEHELGGTVIESDLAECLPMITGDPGHVLQAIKALCVNALESVGHGQGRVVVSTAVEPNGVPLANGDVSSCVRVSVSDTGHGLESDCIETAFVPFVTHNKEKPKRRGAGLGLSVVYRVVRNHGGLVAVEPSDSGGMVFHLLFPVQAM